MSEFEQVSQAESPVLVQSLRTRRAPQFCAPGESHSAQFAFPAEAVKNPWGHAVQFPLPAEALENPGGHAVHPQSCASGCFPAGHMSEFEQAPQTASPVLVHSLRTRRAPQFCIPGESHVAQLALPAAALKDAGGHAVHLHPCAAVWFPAGHMSESEQASQTESPVLVHSRRTRREPQFCIPGDSHFAQSALPAAALYVLVAHAVYPQPCAAVWFPAGHTSEFEQASQTESAVIVHSRRTRREPQFCIPRDSHAAQLALPAAALNVLVAHAVHPQPFALGYCPTGQGVAQSSHTEFWVIVHSRRTRREPQFCIPRDSHAAQSALPAAALYVLVAHAVHPHPFALGCCPAGQGFAQSSHAEF